MVYVGRGPPEYISTRVDTSYENLANFMRDEFRISRKKCSLFRDISCFAKLVLADKIQFRMFRNITFNKRNETAIPNEKNDTFTLKLLSFLDNAVTRFQNQICILIS